MAVTIPKRVSLRSLPWRQLVASPWAAAAAAVVGMVVGAVVSGTGSGFPASWVPATQSGFNSLDNWVTVHQTTGLIFTDFVTPVGDGLGHAVNAVGDVLSYLGWPGVMALAVFAGLAAGGLATGIFAGIVIAGFGLLGVETGSLWSDSMATLSLMTVSIALAVAIGIPLGVAAGFSSVFERLIRPVLDATQMLPAYVYLVPIVILLGIGNPGGVVAAVIYATAPIVRLTSLGIRSVRADVLEAGRSFGSTPWQMLLKVQLPLALRPILLGINQVIMMALSVVVLASLIGTGGLGDLVLSALTTQNLGDAFTAGIAIVAMAMMLDRLVGAFGARAGGSHARIPRAGAIHRRHQLLALGAGVVVAAVLVSHYALGVGDFPSNWSFTISGSINTGLNWLEQHLYHYSSIAVVGGTENLSNFLTLDLLNPLTRFLGDLPWWLAVFGTAAAGAVVAGWTRAIGVGVCVAGVGLLGLWPDADVTLAEVLVALVLCLLVGIPVGIAAHWWDWLDKALRPLLDTLQTMPGFVYLIPVVIFFNVGSIAGVIASFAYALPATIRLTNQGLRQVRPDMIEAGSAFGSTRLQLLVKVELPAARAAMLLAINQTIMLALAEVIVAGLVGGGGLGYDVVVGLDRDEFGLGLAAGLTIVLLGMVLDRLTCGSEGVRRRLPLPGFSVPLAAAPPALLGASLVEG